MATITDIGFKIKQLREKSKLNQTQLAVFLDVDQSYVSQCEKGERQLSLDSLEKLCNLFGIAMGDFFSQDVPNESLNIAFRSNAIENDDLIAISEVNKLALNIKEMRKLLEII